VDIRYTFLSLIEAQNEDNGQVVLEIEFGSRRNSGNTGLRLFKKKSIDCLMIAMLSLLSMGLPVKSYKINTRPLK
jgi:hypothetical protein